VSDIHIANSQLQQVYDYWNQKRGTRIAPSRAEIQPEELPPMALPNLYIIEVANGPPRRFRYRLIGTAISREYGSDPTGRYVDEIDLDSVAREIISELECVTDTANPSASIWHYVKRDGRDLRYEHIVLPLSENGKDVNMLLCAALMRGVG
jgi:hypothetical protein